MSMVPMRPLTIADDPDVLRLAQYYGDVQAAEVFANRHRERFLYCDGRWIEYDGRRWRRDITDRVTSAAKAFADAILLAAITLPDGDGRRDPLRRLGERISRNSSVKAIVELAQSSLPARPDEFDRDDFVLNVRNGTLDLRTGQLRPHDPRHRLTKLAPVAYDPMALAPRWERFLSEVFLGRQDLIDYAQRLVGYALTGDVTEQMLAIFYGGGGNGKGKFVGAIQKMLGDYCLTADVSLFLARRDHGASPDVARLKGARLVVASEMPEGGRLAENLVKSLTGGDRVTARHLYGEFVEFKPTWKFFVATNHKPIVRDDSEGTWRRLKLLPFDARFKPTDEPDLETTLESELAGILRWAVEGCRRWQTDRLRDPAPVAAAVKQYRTDSDAIATFLTERCVERDDCEVRQAHLSAEYREWCAQNNERPLSTKAFLAKIRDRKQFDEREGRAKERFFIGLGLAAPPETSTP